MHWNCYLCIAYMGHRTSSLTCWLLANLQLPHFSNSPWKLFAKFTLFDKFATFAACKRGPLVLLFALSRWLLTKLSKSPARQCKASLAILTISPTSLLRARIFGQKWNKGEEGRSTHESRDIKELSHWLCQQQRQYHKIQIWLVEWLSQKFLLFMCLCM